MEQPIRKKIILSLALAGSLCLPVLAAAAPVQDLRTFAQTAGSGKGEGPAAQKMAGKPSAVKEARDRKKAETPAAGKDRNRPDQKPDDLHRTREVDFTVQRGQMLSEAIGDIDGDGVDEVVDLMGNPAVEKSSFMGDLYLIAREFGPRGQNRVKYYYRPQNLGGYNAYLTLADVTGDGYPDVIIASPSGGSGGMVSYRILDVIDGKFQEIFGQEENCGVSMAGTYLPGWRARLSFPTLKQDITLDLANEKDAYRNLNVYNEDGSLKESGLRPYIQNLSQLSALDVNGDGVDEVVTIQKVLGVLNADPLGFVRTVWEYRAGGWEPRTVGFQAELYSKPTFSSSDKVTGEGDYEIVSLKVPTDNGAVEYPHFQKLDGKLAWKLNHVLESFVRSQLKNVTIGTRLNLDYDVKYSGRHYASLMVLGLLTDRDRSQAITRCWNFNMDTGEEVPLKDMIRPWGKFWKMVEKETAAGGQALKPEDVTGYYFDGEVLGLLYGDQKEVDLEAEKALPFLTKNRPGEVFLTSQSNEGNMKKEAKTEEKNGKTSK